jgi:hypothetical protein
MEFTPKGIPISLRPAFQEYTLEDIDPKTDAFTVIERTLFYGDREELRWLFQQYDSAQVKAWVQNAGWRRLSRRRLKFWTLYFDLHNLPQRKGLWPH